MNTWIKNEKGELITIVQENLIISIGEEISIKTGLGLSEKFEGKYVVINIFHHVLQHSIFDPGNGTYSKTIFVKKIQQS